MKKNYCKNLGEYIEKGMKAQTINQIKKTREIKEEIVRVRKKSRSHDDGWEWKKRLPLHIVTKSI